MFGILIDGFNIIKDAVIKGIDFQKEKKLVFHKEFIEEPFIMLENIYKDYTQAFSELLKNIDEKKNPEETVRIFKMRRLVLLPDRKQLKSFTADLNDLAYKKFLNDVRLKNYYNFIHTVDDFIYATNMARDKSWFSEFVERFEEELLRGRNPFELRQYDSIGGGQDCLPDVRRQIESVLHNEMPNAWGKVCNSYKRLKLSMLN